MRGGAGRLKMRGRVGEGERGHGPFRGGVDLDDLTRKLAAEARSVERKGGEARVRFLSTLAQAQALSCPRLSIPIPILISLPFFVRDVLPFWLKYPCHPSPLPPFLPPRLFSPLLHVSRRTPTTIRRRPLRSKGPQGRCSYPMAPSTRSCPGCCKIHRPLRE